MLVYDIDPPTRQVRQRRKVLGLREHFRFEAPHLTGGRRLLVYGATPHDVPHGRIHRQTLRVVGVLVRSIFAWVTHGLEIAWIETTSFLADTWSGFVNGVLTAWHWVGKQLTKAWNWIKSLFDDSFDADAANQAASKAPASPVDRYVVPNCEAATAGKVLGHPYAIERYQPHGFYWSEATGLITSTRANAPS